MKKALSYIAFFDIVFILLLSVSSVGGIVGKAVYYAAFVLPVLFGLLILRSEGKKGSCGLKIKKDDLFLTLPLLFPTLALVFFISWLTSLLLSALGASYTPDVSGNILYVIFTHAVLTALLEEGLFRLLPLAFISPYSKRAAILFSALFFALAHCNLYQIPYAFFAGCVFAVLDIAAKSVIPSLLIHFVNNLVSIVWLRYGADTGFRTVYIITLVSLAVLSFVPIIICRKKYKEKLCASFSDGGDTKSEYGFAPWLFVGITLFLSVAQLL